MCGIFGYVGHIPEDVAIRSLNLLAHRGPDGYGLWTEPGITLGHRRLAILDLTDSGKQPMSYADGRYHITFNGEIYNFLEIRDELESHGHVFHSQSDTEVILAAFTQWGEDCVNRFNGMWAFAIWDTHHNSLFLSRDRFGKKPLFYAWLPNGDLAFASEMKAIFPILDKVRPNRALVMDTKRIFQYELTDECLVEGIKRFPAAHNAWVQNGTLSARRWWCTLDHYVEVAPEYEGQVEQFRTLFLDACRIRMRSDVPLGTALSGGLDSSAVITSMAHLSANSKTPRMGENWQHAFVASFPNTPLDERHYAEKVTQYLGITPTIIEIDPASAVADLANYFRLFEEVNITSPIPFMQTYAAVKRHGVSVTLDGHGADELFGGYPFDYIWALQDAGMNVSQTQSILDTYYSAFGSHPQLNRLPAKSTFIAKWHAKRLIKKLLGRLDKPVSKDSAHPNWGKLDHLTQRLYVSAHESVLPTILRNYDRYSMASGVEIRMPFMDHRIVSFASSIPWTSKIRNGFSKNIIRDALAPLMPREIAYRKTKIGFNSPVVDWMKGPLKSFLLDTISSQSFLESDLIDQEDVANAIRNVINNPCTAYIDGEQAWTKLSPYLWEEAVIKGVDFA